MSGGAIVISEGTKAAESSTTVVENVLHRLESARQSWWLCSLFTTTILAGCLAFGVLLVFIVLDAILILSQAWLQALAACWMLLVLVLMLLVGRRLLRGQRTLEAAARRAEAAFPELESNLINLVQFSQGEYNGEKAFRQAAMRQAAAEAANVPFEHAPTELSRWGRLLHCLQTPRDLTEALFLAVLLVGAAFFCRHWLPNWSSAAARLLVPWEFTPSVGSVEIVRVTPGDAQVLIGDSVSVSAEVREAAAPGCRALLFFKLDGEPEATMSLSGKAGNKQFSAVLPSLLKSAQYRLQIGDTQTRWYRITVYEKPTMERAEVRFRYPAYLGVESRVFALRELDLEAPEYTVAEMRLHCNVKISKGYLETTSGERYLGRVEDEGRVLAVNLPLLKNDAFIVRLWNEAEHTDPQPRTNRIQVLPDRPPQVEMLKPGRESTAAAGDELPIVIRATDDHGLGRLQLQMKVLQPSKETGEEKDSSTPSVTNESSTAESLLKEWTDFAGNGTTLAVRQFRLTIDPQLVKPGSMLLIRAIAWDRRQVNDWGLDLRPQRTIGAWHTVKILDPSAVQRAALEKLCGLHEIILRLLERQLRARAAAAELLVGAAKIPPPPDKWTVESEKLRTQQLEIRQTASQAAASDAPNESEELLHIRQALARLAAGEMLSAIADCDVLVRPTAAEAERQGAGESLLRRQEHIIEELQRLLNMVRHAELTLSEKMKDRPASDLPDDVKQKLTELAAKLDKFLEQQKKIIETTASLAKKPVDDFTEEDKELLKGLAAAEEDLARFLEELHSDLSKLPEQDFANPSTAQELIEIQTELKMAADALLKKSVEIAVPLEQLGYEMAEELRTNLEKWLPDTPDREKWSQEESPTDKDKEAPMAELPAELEDLVGELMEEEEALFDEMDDVSSSAADSLDAAAGWDAMDGPISNMSAKGVTGNRLPNTSEIGGRSGEGRQGKSSGEMVGDEAVGKGGRNTPTRLTPDPYVKGQIKDHERQSPGGATGGGKESGRGGEGLEGPVPRSPGPRDAQRLADKQAALRNKAEGLDLQFQIANYHRTDLKKLLEVMAQIERDLRAGRYKNALRQRDVLLEGLSNLKQYLGGEFELRRDATPTLPAELQKDILGGLNDPAPTGWEELVRRYFLRLTAAPDAAENAAQKQESQ